MILRMKAELRKVAVIARELRLSRQTVYEVLKRAQPGLTRPPLQSFTERNSKCEPFLGSRSRPAMNATKFHRTELEVRSRGRGSTRPRWTTDTPASFMKNAGMAVRDVPGAPPFKLRPV